MTTLLPIEQPTKVHFEPDEGTTWFFERGLSGFGASYGVTLRIDQVKYRLAQKSGPGDLVYEQGKWWWKVEAHGTL